MKSAPEVITPRNETLDLPLPLLPDLQIQFEAEAPHKRPRLELEVPSMVIVFFELP